MSKTWPDVCTFMSVRPTARPYIYSPLPYVCPTATHNTFAHNASCECDPAYVAKVISSQCVGQRQCDITPSDDLFCHGQDPCDKVKAQR